MKAFLYNQTISFNKTVNCYVPDLNISFWTDGIDIIVEKSHFDTLPESKIIELPSPLINQLQNIIDLQDRLLVVKNDAVKDIEILIN